MPQEGSRKLGIRQLVDERDSQIRGHPAIGDSDPLPPHTPKSAT